MKKDDSAQPESGFPAGLSSPARRALAEAGYDRLEQLAAVRPADLLKLHGFGPKSIRQLCEALAAKNLAFAGDDSKKRNHNE